MERLERLNVLNELFFVSNNCTTPMVTGTRPGVNFTVPMCTVVQYSYYQSILVMVVECILEHFFNDYSQPDTWRIQLSEPGYR